MLNRGVRWCVPVFQKERTMNKSITVRLAKETDADALFRLNRDFNEDEAAGLERIKACLQENPMETVAIAFVGDVPAGFLCGQKLRSMCYDVDYAEITELFVAEEFRRRGVASRLMAFLEEYYREQGIYAFQLFTGGDNHRAQALYEKLGFVRTEEVFLRKRPGPAGDKW